MNVLSFPNAVSIPDCDGLQEFSLLIGYMTLLQFCALSVLKNCSPPSLNSSFFSSSESFQDWFCYRYDLRASRVLGTQKLTLLCSASESFASLYIVWQTDYICVTTAKRLQLVFRALLSWRSCSRSALRQVLSWSLLWAVGCSLTAVLRLDWTERMRKLYAIHTINACFLWHLKFRISTL